MNDLPLYLPADTYMKSLTISADFKPLSEVMQRAIVLLTCSDDNDMKIDGDSIPLFLQKTTGAAVNAIAARLSDIGSALKDKLNSDDGLLSYSEDIVESAYFSVTSDGGLATVRLNIELANNEKEETVIYKYE
jgi:hypothetical protein